MSKVPWPMVPLGEILTPVSRPEPVDFQKSYRILGAHWYARGLYIKNVKTGAAIQAKKVFRVEKGDFVYNRLFAWKGSFAMATEEDHDCYVSNEFPCFIANQERADGLYLWRYFSRSSAWDEALGLSKGGTPTSRNRLKEHLFLNMRIPLPPLSEQRRIVARIEELAGKVEEVRRIKNEIEQMGQQFLQSVFEEITQDAAFSLMAEVAPLIRRPVKVEISDEYPELGVRSFGRGTFQKPSLSGARVGNKKIYWIKPGDLIFSNVFSWEGAIAVAKPEDIGRVGSHRFITCVPKKSITTPSFLRFYFLTGEGLNKVGEASPGGAGRNRTLGLKALANIRVPIPPFEKQLWFDHIQKKVSETKQLGQETKMEVDRMMPSISEKAFNGKL